MPRGTWLLALLWAKQAEAGGRDHYTTNALCTRSNCINPVFPALEDLHRLSAATWYCSTLRKAAPSMGFCRAAINYDPAVMAPVIPGQFSYEDWVQRQDSAAATMFVYHLAGLGMEAWEYSKPEFSDNECVKTIWKMVCYTYFPRSQVGCTDGMTTQYLRPCKSSCQNYISKCNVECCDESVQCVFTHTKAISNTTVLTTTGYAPHDGPSTLCTGAGRQVQPLWLLALPMALAALMSSSPEGKRRPSTSEAARAPRRGLPSCSSAAAGLLLAVLAVTLHGCDVDVPSHTVGNWRGEPDYLLTYEFIPPGGSPQQAILNSCALTHLSQSVQCSGRGVCKRWDGGLTANPTTFCECDRDWADPECRTRRKSQLVAFVLSLFLGFTGADHFYLGFPATGVLKLLTLGGGGIWWIVDAIRVGAGPVPSSTFRVANDLHRWAFALVTVSFACFIGFLLAYLSVLRQMGRRQKESLLLQAEEDLRRKALLLDSSAAATKSSYGAMGGSRWP